jgi:hypothetical protein
MSSGTPSRVSVIFTYTVVIACVVLLLLGALLHGFSLEVQQRFWGNIFDRVGGPMTFRFILQPTMAFIAALHDGIRDARGGHKSFFWSRWLDPSQETGRLREGFTSVARVMALGIGMDVVYQLKELDEFFPAEAAVMAILLAVIPYFIFRWIVEIVARWWLARKSAGPAV